jgi:transmembrane sensor
MNEEKVGQNNLIMKFFAGEISETEMIELKVWLDKDPENRRIFDMENELWQLASIQTKLENYNTDTAWGKICLRLGLGKDNLRPTTILRKKNFRILLAAASVAFLLAFSGMSLWITEKKSFKQIAAASTIITTNEGEKAHIFLSDSTGIVLNAGSKIQYEGHYNLKDRIVKLNGEAFFNVSTNHEKPFVVQLDGMSISATGTRFNVFSFDNEDRIETTLEEGAITVSVKGQKPINVKTGQQVVYFVKSKKVLVRDVVTDTYTSWRENKLRFNDTPFEEVLRRIGRKYNVHFEVTNRDLLNLKYTATFIDESIEEVMLMLKTVSPINYKIYYRTSVNDKQYLKPKIVVGKRKQFTKQS